MKMRKIYTVMSAELENLLDTAFDLSIADNKIDFPYWISFCKENVLFSNKETIQTMIEILEKKIKRKEEIKNKIENKEKFRKGGDKG